jgi:hypothetical protein
MECRAIIDSLSDYLDASKENDFKSIEDHLVNCPGCQSVRLQLTEIRIAARELPLHTPSRAMWARVLNVVAAEAPIAERPTREEVQPLSWWERLRARTFTFTVPQLAGASALTVTVILAGVIGLSRISPTGLGLNGAQTALLLEEDEIKADIDRRLDAINERKASWESPVREGFDAHLTKIENSLSTCRQMLRRNPHDKVHQQMMRALYQEKRQLIEDVERLKW